MSSLKRLVGIAAAGILLSGAAACAGPNDAAPTPTAKTSLEATIAAFRGENKALREEIERLRLAPTATPTPASLLTPTPPPSMQELYKGQLSQLENIIGAEYDSYALESYIQFLKSPNALELARALGNEFETVYIKKYILFLENNGSAEHVKRARAVLGRELFSDDFELLQHPQGISLIELLGKNYSMTAIKRYNELLETGGGLQLAQVLGTSFTYVKINDYISFLTGGGSAEDVKQAKEILGSKFADYNSSEILKLLLQPQGLSLIETLQNRFGVTEIDAYLKLLEAKDAIPLVKALGGEFSYIYTPYYVDFLRKGGKIEHVTRARELMKGRFKDFNLPGILWILAHPKGMSLIEAGGASIYPSYGSYYVKLLDLGLDPRGVARIPDYKVREISDALETSKMPREFIDYFTHSPSEFAIEVAGKNPVFGSDDEKLRAHIKSGITSRSNCIRPGTDYKEDAKQVESIENINILYLIKGYMDYFDNPQNLQGIFEIVEQDISNPYTEEGGLVLPDKEGYRFFRYNLRDGGLKNLENDGSWPVPYWFDYVGRVGIFHMHALGEDNAKYCGPSGSAEYGFGDIGVLKSFNKNNLYEVDVVITKLAGPRINVDIYFRDVFETMLGKANEKEATVVDLGIYEKPAQTRPASSRSLEQTLRQGLHQ